MKCIKSKREHQNPDGTSSRIIVRVSNKAAAKAVKGGYASYCPKEEWKAAGRSYANLEGK
jgi:hypothetical protein